MLKSRRLQPHIDFAHQQWERLVQPGDFVIDATAGNGHDSLALAQLALTASAGKLWTCDVQPQALSATRARLEAHCLPLASRVRYILGCHATLKPDHPVKLVVYNLGYLPGGDKLKTTRAETTLASVRALLPSLLPGGAISVMLYPGHMEGAREAEALLDWVLELPPSQYSCSHTCWLNRRHSPSLLLIQRPSPTKTVS